MDCHQIKQRQNTILSLIPWPVLLDHYNWVCFLSTIELVNTLEKVKLEGKHGRIANRLMSADLVILDKLGYLPFSQSGGALLFHLISKLYEKTSLIITTNLSFLRMGIGLWRPENDDGAAGQTDAPLPHYLNG